MSEKDFTNLSNEIQTPARGTDYIYYNRYISDSSIATNNLCDWITDTKEEVTREMYDAGEGLALFVAQPGAGKTYLFNSDLITELHKRRPAMRLLHASPTCALTEQTGQYESTIRDRKVKTFTVTGKREGANTSVDLRTHPGAISCVYEKLADILQANFDFDLKRLVLIIDEAQDLFTERSYRDFTMTEVMNAIKLIRSKGGKVILTTGTPRVLDGLKFDKKFICRPSAPTSNVGKIVVAHKYDKNCNIIDMIWSEIISYVGEGKRPFIRLNDKKLAAKLQTKAESFGLRGLTLSSDDKGYCIVEGQRDYDSEFYKNVVENACIPEADFYIVTSVLDEGTSVTGIMKEDGTIYQDADIVPVFACLSSEQFNLDKIQQFFIRIRYNYHFAEVLTPYYESKEEGKMNTKHSLPDIKAIRYQMYSDAEARAEGFNFNHGQRRAERSELYTLEGRKEKDFLYLDESEWPAKYRISIQDLFYASWSKYDKEIYRHMDTILESISGVFGVPVEERAVKTIDDINRNETFVCDEDFKALIKEAVSNPEYRRAIESPISVDYKEEHVQAIRKHNRGSQVNAFVSILTRVKPELTDDEIVRMAIENYETGKVSDMGEAETTAAFLERNAFLLLSTLTPAQRSAAVTFADKYYDKASKQIPELNRVPENVKDAILSVLVHSKKYEVFHDLTGYDMNSSNHNYFRLQTTWDKVCVFFASHSLSECKDKISEFQYVDFNQIPRENADGSLNKDYINAVMPYSSVAGATYDILRNAGTSFEKLDENGEMIPGTSLFDGSIQNKTINDTVLSVMSKELPLLIQRKCHNYSMRKISKQRILKLLSMIYSVSTSYTTTSGKKLYAMGNLKKRVVLRNADDVKTKEQAIEEVEGILEDAEFNPSEKEDKKYAEKNVNRVLSGLFYHFGPLSQGLITQIIRWTWMGARYVIGTLRKILIEGYTLEQLGMAA